jgi:hypothetical protein
LNWCRLGWWQLLARCTASAWNHYFLLCVWIARCAGLWFVNELVIDAEMFDAWQLGGRNYVTGLEDGWCFVFCCFCHDALAVGCFDAGDSVEDEISFAIASGVALLAEDAVWFQVVAHAACLHASRQHQRWRASHGGCC